ncbi:Pyruvate synthase subunit PorC / Ketoisovalerate oxidoreductase subunit VorC [Desulfovibrionales bacterium]
MLEVRIHGRGGQGGVTSAELLAQAVIAQGRFAQAFPSFGPERRGAPVVAFVRIDDQKIRLREKIYEPNLILVLDPTLLDIINIAEGLKEGGIIITNASINATELVAKYKWTRVAQVPADIIAHEELGVPITNTTMLGALIKISKVVPLSAMEPVIVNRFGAKLGLKNYKALTRAYYETMIV